MKICVSFRTPLSLDLRDGNLRGEERWERQAFEALLDNQNVTDVFSLNFLWPGSHPKYRGMLPARQAADVILVCHDYNKAVVCRHNYRAIVMNIFSGPWQEQGDEVRQLAQSYGQRLMVTANYKSLFCLHMKPHLIQFFDEAQLALVPTPGAAYVSYEDHFSNDILLWNYRIIFVNTLYDSPQIKWALQRMQCDNSLCLKIVVGWRPGEAKDLISGRVVALPDNFADYFWSMPSVNQYRNVANRVEIIGELPYKQMLMLYDRSKLVIPHARFYGGPPIEAGMHGVPFVGSHVDEGALAYWPGYLAEADTAKHIELLDRLLCDERFYAATAHAYRQIVLSAYSYEAFNRELNALLRNRGLTP